jgi:hypothetical protein
VSIVAVLSALAVSSAFALDIVVDKQPPVGEVNSPYEFEFEGEEGCENSWFTRHVHGTLPPGLQVTRDLKLVGTPTEAGDFTFWVELADEGCPVVSDPSQGEFRMTVLPDLYVKTESVPPATIGSPYTTTLEHAGYDGGYDAPRWLIKEGALPDGLALDPATGVVSGTPPTGGEWSVLVRVEEPFRRSGEKRLTFIVAATLTAAAPASKRAEVGIRYAAQPTSAGGVQPVTWSVAGAPLPPGLTLNPSTGAVSGIPTRAGEYTVVLEVEDRVGSSQRVTFVISVARKLLVTTRGAVPVPAGRRVAIELASVGGVAPVVWTVAKGRLPSGLRLDRRTGAIVGRTTTPGVYRVTVRARDALGAVATSRLVLRVR